ncbi:hypothetical protein DL98DRAFT_315797 [Cadophora sp. DSE1049]|nr:hypothetical protein DL98DRAFT_315797 [Cadophora sp. DSE1049]
MTMAKSLTMLVAGVGMAGGRHDEIQTRRTIPTIETSGLGTLDMAPRTTWHWRCSSLLCVVSWKLHAIAEGAVLNHELHFWSSSALNRNLDLLRVFTLQMCYTLDSPLAQLLLSVQYRLCAAAVSSSRTNQTRDCCRWRVTCRRTITSTPLSCRELVLKYNNILLLVAVGIWGCSEAYDSSSHIYIDTESYTNPYVQLQLRVALLLCHYVPQSPTQ